MKHGGKFPIGFGEPSVFLGLQGGPRSMFNRSLFFLSLKVEVSVEKNSYLPWNRFRITSKHILLYPFLSKNGTLMQLY
jgi:hypothetical protein